MSSIAKANVQFGNIIFGKCTHKMSHKKSYAMTDNHKILAC